MKERIVALSESQNLLGIVPLTKRWCNERVRIRFGIFDVYLFLACRQHQQWAHGSARAPAYAAKGGVYGSLRQQPAADRLRDLLPGSRGGVPAIRPHCRP